MNRRLLAIGLTSGLIVVAASLHECNGNLQGKAPMHETSMHRIAKKANNAPRFLVQGEYDELLKKNLSKANLQGARPEVAFMITEYTQHATQIEYRRSQSQTEAEIRPVMAEYKKFYSRLMNAFVSDNMRAVYGEPKQTLPFTKHERDLIEAHVVTVHTVKIGTPQHNFPYSEAMEFGKTGVQR